LGKNNGGGRTPAREVADGLEPRAVRAHLRVRCEECDGGSGLHSASSVASETVEAEEVLREEWDETSFDPPHLSSCVCAVGGGCDVDEDEDAPGMSPTPPRAQASPCPPVPQQTQLHHPDLVPALIRQGVPSSIYRIGLSGKFDFAFALGCGCRRGYGG
jgi:hypothetical protein